MNLSDFAERLSELMFEAEWNGHTLAKQLKCSDRTINRYLRCDREPTVEMLVSIADFFHCTTDFLLGLENENYSTNFKKCPPFKERFPELLQQLGVSQYRLGKDAKISHSALLYWKRGTKQPTVTSIVRIAKKYGKTVDFVLGRTNL